jgi:peptidyl-prolyl cis-trans isomerase C
MPRGMRRGMGAAFLIFLFGISEPSWAEHPKNDSATVAEVNGVKISRARLNRETDFRLQGEQQRFNDHERHELEQHVLDDLINRELLIQAAAREKLLPSEDEFNSFIAQSKARFQSEAEFRQMLTENHLQEKDFLAGAREDLAIQHYIQKKIYEGVRLGSKEAQEYLQAHPLPEEIQARQIFFRVNNGASDEQRDQVLATAEKVLLLLQQDTSKFSALAKEYSDGPSRAKGGDLGFFTRNQMPAAFSDAAFRLQPGELSGLVETDQGYHIILVEKRRGGARDADGAQLDKVRKALLGEKRRQALLSALSELRKSAQVKVLLAPQ